MQSSTNSPSKPRFFTRKKNYISQLTEGWMLELSLLATILFCISFWSQLPDFNINPIVGKGIAAIGILVLFGIIAYKVKWPIIIGVAGLVVYMGISFMQGTTLKEMTTTDVEENHTSFVNNTNTIDQ